MCLELSSRMEVEKGMGIGMAGVSKDSSWSCRGRSEGVDGNGLCVCEFVESLAWFHGPCRAAYIPTELCSTARMFIKCNMC